MIIKSCISKYYQKVDAYSGVNMIEDILLENKFLAVFDGENFCGVLTPSDLIKRPHKLVIDCLTEKDKLRVEDSIIYALRQLCRNQSCALPVFDGDNYIGIIEKENIIEALLIRIDELYYKSLIAHKARTEFLKNLSHEIRTPLNGILGFLDIISGMDLNHLETEGEEYVSFIRESSDSFLLLMNDLVELSLIQSGEKLRVNNEIVNLEKLFVELKSSFKVRLMREDKNLILDYANPDSSLNLCIDRKKLYHIFYRIIENAIKFSEKNNHITFGFTGIVNTKANFFVTNTGSPIKEKDKLKIFETFEKQDVPVDQRPGGLGIGLAIVRNFLDAMDGSIDVLTGTGNKTTFQFSILVKENQNNLCPA